MRIQDAQIALGSERLATRYSRFEESLRATVANGGVNRTLDAHRVLETSEVEFESYGALARTRMTPARAPIGPPTFVPLRVPSPRAAMPVAVPSTPPPVSAAEEVVAGDGDLLLLKLLIEVLSGREIRVAHVEIGSGAALGEIPAPGPSEPFSIDYSFSSYTLETEQSSFRASGEIVTEDGRRIAFDVQVERARRFESSSSFTLQAGQRKDPLALDLAGGAPQLGTVRFAFDLDADGRVEQMAFTTGSSAFLALDGDGDGRIGDGRELFGALSGDGFADLARFDIDGNGFIDAGDPVFAELLAWRKDAAGNDRLDGLSALGIGALYLGSVAAPFELRGPGNETLGAVRASGVYLREDGGAGVLQQLDLVV